jgi:hypothetical protein
VGVGVRGGFHVWWTGREGGRDDSDCLGGMWTGVMAETGNNMSRVRERAALSSGWPTLKLSTAEVGGGYNCRRLDRCEAID